MMARWQRIAGTALAVALSFAGACHCRAGGMAVVVGINNYPYLEGGTLKGAVGDATRMARALAGAGFSVVSLTDSKASKQAILAAIQRAETKNLQGKPFVFYFAGHGTDQPVHGFLPYDARRLVSDTYVTAKELYVAVKAVPAGNRTVILDSCFSGGMLWSGKSLGGLTPRYYDMGQPRGIDPVTRQDDNHVLQIGDGVGYVTASRGNQVANERPIHGEPSGIFTHFLLPYIDGKKRLWRDVQPAVSARVSEATEGLQTPTLTPRLLPQLMFAAQPANEPAAAKPQDLWTQFHRDNPSADKVLLRMAPNKTTLRVDEEISFSIRAGVAGYLLVLEQGTSGRIHLLTPSTGQLQDAYVSQGQTVRIPEDVSDVYAPDAVGHQRIRAFLFTSRSSADAMLRCFQGATQISPAKAKDLVLRPARLDAFYTSDIQFEVTHP